MAISKAERRRNAARRVREAAKARRRRMSAAVLTPLGGVIGQGKAMANKTLGKSNVPVQYAAGGALAGLSLLQPPSRESMASDAAFDLGIGMITGEAAVRRHKRTTTGA